MFLTGLQSFRWCRMAAVGVRVQLRDWTRNRERLKRLARRLERWSKEVKRIFAAIMFGMCMTWLDPQVQLPRAVDPINALVVPSMARTLRRYSKHSPKPQVSLRSRA
jgi:hypothetical protein